MKKLRLLCALLLVLTLGLALCPAAFAATVPAPAISLQPKNITVAEDAYGTFSVYSANGTKYQWQVKDGGSWKDCTEPGSKTSTLTVSGKAENDGKEYRCVISNAGGSSESSAAVLSIKFRAPSIMRQPQTVKAAEDEQVEMTIQVSGSDLVYQWQVQKDKSNVWTDCTGPGADKDTIQLKAVAENKDNKYRCIVSNRGGSFTSNVAYLLVKLRSEEAVEQVQALTKAKNYDEAISYGEDYYKGIPMAERDPEMLRACVNAYVLKAEALQADSQRQQAEELLAHCVELYKGTEAVKQAEKAALGLEAVLTRGEPLNGIFFHPGPKGGTCELEIKVGDQPVLVKMEDVTNPDNYLTVYIRAKQSVKFNIKDGSYRMKYATGSRWYSEKELFGTETAYSQADKTFSFTTTRQGSYIYWDSRTVTLKPVENGNLSSAKLDADDF